MPYFIDKSTLSDYAISYLMLSGGHTPRQKRVRRKLLNVFDLPEPLRSEYCPKSRDALQSRCVQGRPQPRTKRFARNDRSDLPIASNLETRYSVGEDDSRLTEGGASRIRRGRSRVKRHCIALTASGACRRYCGLPSKQAHQPDQTCREHVPK